MNSRLCSLNCCYQIVTMTDIGLCVYPRCDRRECQLHAKGVAKRFCLAEEKIKIIYRYNTIIKMHNLNYLFGENLIFDFIDGNLFLVLIFAMD